MSKSHGPQVCTFPYALFSTPTFNSYAYPVQIDSGSYSKPNYFIVFSPVHYPTHVGHYKTRQAAQRKADEINSKGKFIYSPLTTDQAFLFIEHLQAGGQPTINFQETETMTTKTTQDARALSSGTLSYLIDNTNYAEIDKVQAAFINFCIEHEGEFENWKSAWKAFYPEYTQPRPDTDPTPVFDLVAGAGAPQFTFLPAPDQQLALL